MSAAVPPPSSSPINPGQRLPDPSPINHDKAGRSWTQLNPKATLALKTGLIAASVLLTLVAPQTILLTATVIFLTARSLKKDYQTAAKTNAASKNVFAQRKEARKAEKEARAKSPEEKASVANAVGDAFAEGGDVDDELPDFTSLNQAGTDRHIQTMLLEESGAVVFDMTLTDKDLNKFAGLNPVIFGLPSEYVKTKSKTFQALSGNSFQTYLANEYAGQILKQTKNLELTQAIVELLVKSNGVTSFKIDLDAPEGEIFELSSRAGTHRYTREDLESGVEWTDMPDLDTVYHDMPSMSDLDSEEGEKISDAARAAAPPPSEESQRSKRGGIDMEAISLAAGTPIDRPRSPSPASSSENSPRSAGSDISATPFTYPLFIGGQVSTIKLNHEEMENLAVIPAEALFTVYPNTDDYSTLTSFKKLDSNEDRAKFIITRLTKMLDDNADAILKIVAALADSPNNEDIEFIDISNKPDFKIDITYQNNQKRTIRYDSAAKSVGN